MWLRLIESREEYSAWYSAHELADRLTLWEGTPPELEDIVSRLYGLKLGVITTINGHRVVKVENEMSPL